MRISIKIKFSIFLAVLLLLTVFLVSSLALEGIRRNQQSQVEQYLARQAVTANIYFIQSIMAEPNKVPQTFLAAKGQSFAEELEMMTGQPVVLYDRDGERLNGGAAAPPPEGVRQTLDYALHNKTAYVTEREALYYMAPLRTGSEQVGVVQFHYDLADNLAFYNGIRHLFAAIGAGVFVVSFVLAYFYFNAFAGAIIRLNGAVGQIRDGHYPIAIQGRKRKDEIGELGEGIRAMSEQIARTIRDKDEEQEKLALAVRKLSLLDRQQKQFIGSVSHEFKTPLTSIQAYLDLLDMYPDDEELLISARANIQSETQRLYEMVEKVLQLSALEKYDFEFSPEQLDMRQLIWTVLSSLQGKMDKFGIRLETDLADVRVEADKDSMMIVLVNLLDNAVKYNKPGGRIAVACRLADGQAVIEIADTGIGIPEVVAPKIFDPFFTVDRNRSRATGGAGLGLALARTYAEKQGGTLELIRTNAEGTAFRLRFPAVAASPPA